MPGPYYAKIENSQTKSDLLGTSTTEKILIPSGPGVIDVINDFMWTASPQINKFKKVPILYLTERKQTLNSLLASALYYLNAGENATKNVATNATAGLAGLATNAAAGIAGLVTSAGATIAAGASPDAATYDKINNIATKISTLLPNAVSYLSTGVEKFIKSIDAFKVGSESDIALLEDLQSYIGIYKTEVTKFEYALPYFDNNSKAVSNSWGEAAQGPGFAKEIVEGIEKIGERLSNTININQPGTFIEKPKYFQYDTDNKSVTVTFPLFNTVTRGTGSISNNKLPYQQNYELLWILAFQNKPYRTSFSGVSPAKMYTLTIPGQEFFPYCFIENLTVDFKGTRRNLPVTLPTGDIVSTAIPEAYNVSITFKSLISDVSNMMVAKGFTGSKIRVSQQ